MNKPLNMLAILSSALLLPAAIAQNPAPAPAPAPADPLPKPASAPAIAAAPADDLMSLRGFLGERIHASGGAAKSNSDAKTTAKPLATVHDAIVGKQGEMQTIIVVGETPVDGTPAVNGIVEVRYYQMPAKDLRWNAQEKRFETALDAAAIAALPRHQPVRAGAGAEDGAPISQDVLASTLLQSKPKPSDQATSALGPVARIWFEPKGLQLAFLGIESGGLRVIPWQVVRLEPMQQDGALSLNATQQDIEGAPKLASGAADLDAATRAQAYKHFKLPAPAWDSAAGGAEARDKQPDRTSKRDPGTGKQGKQP